MSTCMPTPQDKYKTQDKPSGGCAGTAVTCVGVSLVAFISIAVLVISIVILGRVRAPANLPHSKRQRQGGESAQSTATGLGPGCFRMRPTAK